MRTVLSENTGHENAGSFGAQWTHPVAIYCSCHCFPYLAGVRQPKTNTTPFLIAHRRLYFSRESLAGPQ